MQQRNNIFLYLFFGLLLTACKKDLPSWQGDYVFPIAHGSLKIQNLVKDHHILENPDQSLVFTLSDTLFQLRLDTMLKTTDTSLVDSFTWTFSSFTLFPNQEVFAGEEESRYKLKDVELKHVKIRSGKIYFKIYNTIQEKLLVNYKLPKVTKEGNDIEILRLVDAGSPGNNGFLEDSIDLAGYDIDFTGKLGNKNNILYSTYSIRVDPAGHNVVINPGDHVKIITSLKNMIPQYGSGFLGSNDNRYAATSYFDVFKNISGLIDMDEVDIQLNVQNGLGVDARLTFQEIETENTATNSQKTLLSPWIGQAINISRAWDDVPGYGPVHYTNYPLNFDKSNSNIDELIEILPDSLNYDIRFELNPLGNISNGTDFIYLDETVNIIMNTQIPLKFAASGFTLTDTFDLNWKENQQEFVNNTHSATIHVFASNYFPVEAVLSLYFIDEMNENLGALGTAQVLKAARWINPNTQAVESRLDFILNEDGIQKLLKSKSLLVSSSFSTDNFPNKVQLYSTQMLDVQITLDLSQQVP